jgi:hypothetical protein
MLNAYEMTTLSEIATKVRECIDMNTEMLTNNNSFHVGSAMTFITDRLELVLDEIDKVYEVAAHEEKRSA